MKSRFEIKLLILNALQNRLKYIERKNIYTISTL